MLLEYPGPILSSEMYQKISGDEINGAKNRKSAGKGKCQKKKKKIKKSRQTGQKP